MTRDDVKALADRERAKARRIAESGRVARHAAPAKPAEPAPVPPEKPALRLVEGGKAGQAGPGQKNAPAPAAGRRLKVSDEMVARARGRGKPPVDPTLDRAFSAYKPPPGVLPEGRKIAQDSALPGVAWANGAFLEGAWFEGMQFLGYPYLASLLQRAEYRRAAERLATEMTRKWIRIASKGDTDKTAKIAQLETRLKELKMKEAFAQLAVLDNGFGRAHLYIDTGDTDDPKELKTPIGNGRNKITQRKVGKGSIKRLGVVEPVWCYPAKYNANDPLRPDWYTPETWFCMGKEIHRSRLLPFVGREVPDLLKPSYAFGGLSLSQMLKPYVDNWLDVRQSIARLIQKFSTSGIKTDLQQMLAPNPGESSDDFFKRLDLFVTMAKNEGLMVLNQGTEDFFQFNVPLGTLDQLQGQSQEQMASACGIPVVVLLGLTPHGLNACLTGDTLIETDQGDVAIRDVRPGQKVMTRDGWAPVAKAGCTAYATELVEIEAAGSVVRCTAEHKIWLPSISAFVPAENVRPGDILLCRGATEKRSTGTQSPTEAYFGGIVGTDITRPRAHIRARQSFTERFGAFITAPFRRAITFITSIGTAETINSIISKYLAPKPTLECMALPTGSLSASRSTGKGNADIAANGSWWGNLRELNFAVTGAGWPTDARTERQEPSRARSVVAACAESPLKRNAATQSIALENVQARAKTDQATCQITTGNTQRNGPDTPLSGTPSVVSSVRRVPAQEFVYDIQVATGYLPEFFANGICVHNSSDGEIRAFEDWVMAYQAHFYGDNVQRVIDFAMVDLWGEVDPEIGYEWIPLHSLDEKGQAEVQKTKSDVDNGYVDRGVLDPLEVRRKLAADPNSGYNGIDVEDVPELPDAGEGENGDDPFGGGDPQPENDNENPDGKNSKLSKF